MNSRNLLIPMAFLVLFLMPFAFGLSTGCKNSNKVTYRADGLVYSRVKCLYGCSYGKCMGNKCQPGQITSASCQNGNKIARFVSSNCSEYDKVISYNDPECVRTRLSTAQTGITYRTYPRQTSIQTQPRQPQPATTLTQRISHPFGYVSGIGTRTQAQTRIQPIGRVSEKKCAWEFYQSRCLRGNYGYSRKLKNGCTNEIKSDPNLPYVYCGVGKYCDQVSASMAECKSKYSVRTVLGNSRKYYRVYRKIMYNGRLIKKWFGDYCRIEPGQFNSSEFEIREFSCQWGMVCEKQYGPYIKCVRQSRR